MRKGTYIKLAGFISLLGWVMAAPSLAEPALHAEPLAYSPDRWPSRWSAIIRQNQATGDEHAYGYGSYQARPVRHENPWAHDSSVLFEVPAGQGHRPWGEPPRKTRRQQARAGYYRDQRRAVYRSNPLYNPYRYAGMAGMAGMVPQAYPGLGYMNPFGGLGGLGGFGLANPYGVSPLLGSPLLPPPLLGGYPYAGYPSMGYPAGMGGMNRPFGAW